MSERRKAPRRRVVHITRVGKWGERMFRHELECGHVEELKRSADTQQIACLECLGALRAVDADWMKLKIAVRLQVEPDDVQLTIDQDGEVTSGVVFLTAPAIKRLV